MVSDTRWTVIHDSQYYSALQVIKRVMKMVLKKVQRHGNQGSHNWCSDTNKFNHFSVKLAILLLRHSGNLSTTLRSPKLSASQAQSIARKIVIFAVSNRSFNRVEINRY